MANRLTTGVCGLVAGASGLVLLAGCGSSEMARSYEERLQAELRPWQELEQQKADLWYAGMQSEDFVFQDSGTVNVKRWALQGWPGDEYVKIRLTYTNTTDKPVVHAFVWLEVLDQEGNVWGAGGVRLFNPMGYPIWPGASVVDEIQAKTNGIHKKDGWGWGVACAAQVDNDPGDKPRLVVEPAARGFQNTPWPTQAWPRNVQRSRHCVDRPGITSW